VKTIERVGALSSREFQRQFVATETPVILTRMIDDWPAKGKWSKEYFRRHHGAVNVSVEVLERDLGSSPEYYLASKKKQPMTLSDYVKRTEDLRDGRLYAAQLPIRRVIPEAAKDLGRFPYVWRCLGGASGLTELLWMGPAGCTSGLHFDESHNFNVQLQGRRKWVIFPRSQQHLLYVPSHLEPNYFSPIDYANPDLERFPRYREATPIEFEIEAGETLFLPLGWVHCVWALEFSIAINLWWVTPAQAIERLPWFLKDRGKKLLRRMSLGRRAAPRSA
jgi:[protein]-arginine 3-hydroxylase / protease